MVSDAYNDSLQDLVNDLIGNNTGDDVGVVSQLLYSDNVLDATWSHRTLVCFNMIDSRTKSELAITSHSGSPNPIGIPKAIPQSIEVFAVTDTSQVTWGGSTPSTGGATQLLPKTTTTDSAGIWHFDYDLDSDGYCIGLIPRVTWMNGVVIYIRYTAAPSTGT